MFIFNQIPAAFPAYDNIKKQNRYRENCVDNVDYKLFAPKNALLPWQYRRIISGSEITKFAIVRVDNLAEMDISVNISLIKKQTLEEYDYFYYGGDLLTYGGIQLNLAYGYYYAYVQFNDNTFIYTEMFFIPQNPFNAQDYGTDYLKLEWYNMAGDVDPFYYSDLSNGLPVFRNVCYLDTFITSSEPVIEQVTLKDGYDNDIPTFIKATIPHKINLFIPDFLKVAITLIQLHDTINFTSAGGVYKGQINSTFTTQNQTEVPGCMSVVDILWSETLAVVNRSVSTNLIKATAGTLLNYLKATKGDQTITYNGDGQVVFTSPFLIGKTGYAVASQQDGPNSFLGFDQLEYDADAGSVTITAPGYDIVPNYYIFVFYNLIDISDFPV